MCQGDLADGDLILVCGGCRERLGGGVSVRATGEFRVPSDLMAEMGPAVASESSPGDGLWRAESEVAVFVLEFMQAKLHLGFSRRVFARS